MFLPLPTPDEMARWDHETINGFGIPGLTLMESASRAAVSVLLAEYGPVDGAEIICFAGSGNNGGDAFAMARQLIDLGADVTVFHTRPKHAYRGETRLNLLWAQKAGVTLNHIRKISSAPLRPDIIIDGLLGTGLHDQLREAYLSCVRRINEMGKNAYVFSIDIPSGLNGLTGAPSPEAVIADVTVSFEAPKLGLLMPGTSRFTGILHIEPIGIPGLVQKKHPVSHHLISDDIMEHIPMPSPDMHKGNAGHVLIIGGSAGLTGAPHLAALGALRSGAGLVTIACPGSLADSIKAGNPNIMVLPLGAGDHWSAKEADIMLGAINRFDSVVLGPGLGRTRKTVDFVRSFIAQCPARLVLDADALYCLAQLSGPKAKLPLGTILTPHPGEMATLLGISTAKVQSDRFKAAKTFVAATDVTLVLKGAGTIVADRKCFCISPFSEPNLAVAGSGDVLSGVIGTLSAQKLLPVEAAALGVYWHALAGRQARKEFPTRGNVASEIADMLPMVAKQYLEGVQSC